MMRVWHIFLTLLLAAGLSIPAWAAQDCCCRSRTTSCCQLKRSLPKCCAAKRTTPVTSAKPVCQCHKSPPVVAVAGAKAPRIIVVHIMGHAAEPEAHRSMSLDCAEALRLRAEQRPHWTPSLTMLCRALA